MNQHSSNCAARSALEPIRCEHLNRLCPFPESDCGRNAPVVRAEVEVRQHERSRMGRELHDSTAQTLVALQLKVMYLKEMFDDARYRGALGEVEQAIHELHEEIRAVSFINNLPPLQPGTLSKALKVMTTRFGEMTGLQCLFCASGTSSGTPLEAEAALYRIGQEALANVYRHARASRVQVRLEVTASSSQLVVKDDGIGIGPRGEPPMKRGMGVQNIRTRVRELNGRVAWRRLKRGMRLTVTIPHASEPANPWETLAGTNFAPEPVSWGNSRPPLGNCPDGPL